MRQLLVSASLLFRGVFRRWWAWVVGSLLAFCGLYRTYIKPELPQDYRYDIPVWLLWIVGALSLAWAAVRAYHELRMKMLDLQKQVENEQELRHRLALLERQAAPRTLTDKQQALIISSLSAHHESREITIVYALQTPDARTYAKDFVEAFKQADWKVDGPVGEIRENRVGVCILGRDPGGKQPRSEEIIKTALTGANVPVSVSRESSLADLVLFVGIKPEDTGN